VKAVLSWILEYLPSQPSQAEVIDALIRSGTEVDAVETVPAGVIAARVLELTPVPKSTRGVRMARIDTGAGELTVLTGAPNVSAGDLVPYAKPGVHLPGWPKPLATRVMFGIESPGMLLSESELGLGDAADGLLLLAHGNPGDQMETLMPLPVVLTVEPTTNRPDLLSHFGLAREVAAVLRIPLVPPAVINARTLANGEQALSDAVSITVEDGDLCRRFIAASLDGIKPLPSPNWMRTRLELAGMRSMGLAVDITNYVALEVGQPLHAFDREKIDPGYHHASRSETVSHTQEISLAVSLARDDQSLACLDGVGRKLAATDVVVTRMGVPISMAGIMGGESTSVDDATTAIVLEAATWSPIRIRESSSRSSLRTEASARFEKGLSPELADQGMARALFLFEDLMGARLISVSRWAPALQEPSPILVTETFLDDLLGFHPGINETVDILERLGFLVRMDADPPSLLVTPPPIRLDVSRDVDVAEEIGRVHGYDSVPGKLPAIAPRTDMQPGEQPVDQRVKDILVGAGFSEVINYSFVPAAQLHADTWIQGLAGQTAQIPVINPLSEEWACMRTSLLPQILANLADNLHRNVSLASVFEYGKVFWESSAKQDRNKHVETPALPVETWMAGVGASALSESDAVDVFRHCQATFACIVQRISGHQLLFREPSAPITGYHDSRCAELYLETGETVGILGEAGSSYLSRLDVTHRLVVGELALTSIISTARRNITYLAPPRWPAVSSDLSIRVPASAKAGDALNCITRAGGELLEACSIYDEYHGKELGETLKAWSFHLTFRDPSGNMSREQALQVEEKIRGALATEFGATAR